MAGIINGRNLNLYYILNGYTYPVCHATDCKISLVAETKESTTKNNIKGKTYIYQGKYSFTLSLTGITNLVDTANISVFQDAILLSNKLQFIFTDSENIQWSGTVLINQVDVDSPVSNASTFSNAMMGDGELTKVTTGIIPPPIGSSVTIVDQFTNVLAIIPAPGTYSVTKFDSIDLGDSTPTTPVIIITES